MSFKAVKELVVFGNPIQGAIEGNSEGLTDITKLGIDNAKNFSAFDTGAQRNSFMANLPGGAQYGFNDSGGVRSEYPLQTKPKPGITEAYAGSAQRTKDGKDVYPVYTEFGTRFQAPQPALRPGFLIGILNGVFKKVVILKQLENMKGALKSPKQKRESFGL